MEGEEKVQEEQVIKETVKKKPKKKIYKKWWLWTAIVLFMLIINSISESGKILTIEDIYLKMGVGNTSRYEVSSVTQFDNMNNGMVKKLEFDINLAGETETITGIIEMYCDATHATAKKEIVNYYNTKISEIVESGKYIKESFDGITKQYVYIEKNVILLIPGSVSENQAKNYGTRFLDVVSSYNVESSKKINTENLQQTKEQAILTIDKYYENKLKDVEDYHKKKVQEINKAFNVQTKSLTEEYIAQIRAEIWKCDVTYFDTYKTTWTKKINLLTDTLHKEVYGPMVKKVNNLIKTAETKLTRTALNNATKAMDKCTSSYFYNYQEIWEAKILKIEKRLEIKEYKNSCKKYSFNTIARNPDKYDGKKMKFTGEVIQVLEVGDTVTIRLNVTKNEYGWYEDTIYCVYNYTSGESKILEDDIITIWGECKGDYSYTSIFGATITLPKVDVKYVTIK